MVNETRISYEFGPYKLDAAKRLLIRDGTSLPLPPKTFDLLLTLLQGRGRVFTKKELMNALWPETFVEDASLSFQISVLRKALGETGTEWIETLPRYGYRFTGDISEVPQDLGAHGDINFASHEPRTGLTNLRVETLDTQLRPSSVQRPVPMRMSRAILYYGVPVLSILIIASFLMTRGHEPTHLENVIRFNISPPDRVTLPDLDSISLSPDGTRLIFVGRDPDGKKQLWTRPLGSLTAERISGTELVDGAFWSPDSLSVGYFSDGKLRKLALQNGVSQTICDAPPGPSTGTWNRDGVILFHTDSRSEIYRVSANGGRPTVWNSMDSSRRELRHSNPQFLPDGHHFIYSVESEQAENTGVYVASLDIPGSKRLVNSYANAVPGQFAGSSYLLFTRGTDLLAQSFDLVKLALVGTPLLVARQVLIEKSPGASISLISSSTNGVLAYRTRIDNVSKELTWFDRAGRRLDAVSGPADYSNPSLSPDEKKLLVTKGDEQLKTRDIWLFDLMTGASSRFTFDPTDKVSAVWSPDGSRVAFSAFHSGVADLYEKAIDGTSEPTLLLHSSESKTIRSWSPDGRYLLFVVGSNTFGFPMEANAKPIGPYSMEHAVISPNGRWAAYTSVQSGRSEVYVQSFPNPKGKWQISTNGGMEPTWRKDGKELFYVSGDELIAVQVKTDSPAFESGVPKALFKVRLEARTRRRYQVAANGQRFLVNVSVGSSVPITVVANWPLGVVR